MKKNKAKITFYPFSKDAESFAPAPVPALKTVPSWYKIQPGSYDDSVHYAMGSAPSTIKRCMPIFDAMTAGYNILTPCDIYVDARDPEKLIYSVPNALGEIRSKIFASHAPEQYSYYPIDSSRYHKHLLRIHPLWVATTEKGYSCLMTQPIHQDASPIVAFSGIIDTDSFMSDGHMSFLVEKGFNGIIKQGTPLIQVIPFKREAWESEIAKAEDRERIKSRQTPTLRSSFVNGYKNKFRSKKEYK